MRVTLADHVIAEGTPGGEPCRLADGKGSRNVHVSNRIASESPGLLDLGNAIVEDALEAEYEYPTAIDAYLGYAARRNAALGLAAGPLKYEGETVAAGALVRDVKVVEWKGVSVVIRYEVVGVRPPAGQ